MLEFLGILYLLCNIDISLAFMMKEREQDGYQGDDCSKLIDVMLKL